MDRPVLELEHSNGAILRVGIDPEASAVTFNSPGDRPPYFVSASDPARRFNHSIEFLYDDVPTEFSPSELIEPAIARRAAREFVERGERPAGLRWDEV